MQMHNYSNDPEDRVDPATALLAFAGWLTSREGVSGPFSARHDAAGMVELVKVFCEAQAWNVDDAKYEWQIKELRRHYPTEMPNLPTANPKPGRRGMFAMPSPTPEQVNDPLFTAIWEVIKTWDVNVPEYYEGYCGANGSHVMLLFNELIKPAE